MLTNSHQAPVLNIHQDSETLHIEFPRSATTGQLDPIFVAIGAKLGNLPAGINRVLFDLAAVDPVMSNAGRVLDLVRSYQAQSISERIRLEMKLPLEIYEDLMRTDDLPEPAGSDSSVHGIDIRLSDHEQEPANLILDYTGKIRQIRHEEVTASLWIDEDEVIGKFHRSQFPDGTLQVGQVFNYRAVVSERGKTEVFLTPAPENPLGSDELLDLWRIVEAQIPDGI